MSKKFHKYMLGGKISAIFIEDNQDMALRIHLTVKKSSWRSFHCTADIFLFHVHGDNLEQMRSNEHNFRC